MRKESRPLPHAFTSLALLTAGWLLVVALPSTGRNTWMLQGIRPAYSLQPTERCHTQSAPHTPLETRSPRAAMVHGASMSFIFCSSYLLAREPRLELGTSRGDGSCVAHWSGGMRVSGQSGQRVRRFLLTIPSCSFMSYPDCKDRLCMVSTISSIYSPYGVRSQDSRRAFPSPSLFAASQAAIDIHRPQPFGG
jgi:hypothetical protein